MTERGNKKLAKMFVETVKTLAEKEKILKIWKVIYHSILMYG